MKVAGCCSVSGEECFDVLEYWPADHPVYPGQPRKMGKAHDDALRLTLVLMNGSQMNLTIKEQYLADFHLALPQVWALIKQTTRHIRKGHKALGQQAFDAMQHAQADVNNLQFNDNVPLGVLCWERWKNHGG